VFLSVFIIKDLKEFRLFRYFQISAKNHWHRSRRVNIQFGVDSDGKEYKLTRKQYYQQSGMIKNKKKVEKWNLKNKAVLEELSKNSPKTDNLSNYLEVVSENYDTLWNNQKSLKWSRERMHLWIGKNRTLDRFYASMGKNLTVAYGSAKFAPTGPGELAVPTTDAFKRCSKHFKIKLIDEFRTSKMCSCCGEESQSCIWRIKRFAVFGDVIPSFVNENW